MPNCRDQRGHSFLGARHPSVAHTLRVLAVQQPSVQAGAQSSAYACITVTGSLWKQVGAPGCAMGRWRRGAVPTSPKRWTMCFARGPTWRQRANPRYTGAAVLHMQQLRLSRAGRRATEHPAVTPACLQQGSRCDTCSCFGGGEEAHGHMPKERAHRGGSQVRFPGQ